MDAGGDQYLERKREFLHHRYKRIERRTSATVLYSANAMTGFDAVLTRARGLQTVALPLS